MIDDSCFSEVAMSVCYILDGILLLYGIVLTVSYCLVRRRFNRMKAHERQSAEGSIYAGLTSKTDDTYETIQKKKKKKKKKSSTR